MIKLLSHFHPEWELYHIRTFDGMEVDFFITNGEKAIAIEVKHSDQVHPHDARHLKKVDALTGINSILKIVVYEGSEIKELGPGIVGIPAYILFGQE